MIQGCNDRAERQLPTRAAAAAAFVRTSRNGRGPPAQDPAAPSDNQAVTGPAFRFRLERVRAVRERKEKLAQRELADAILRRSSTVAELRSADASVEHARAQQRSVGEGVAVSATDLLAHQVFLERTEEHARARARELEQ